MTLTRRRFFTLASAACLAPVAGRANIYRWHGTALGAKAQIILDHFCALQQIGEANLQLLFDFGKFTHHHPQGRSRYHCVITYFVPLRTFIP